MVVLLLTMFLISVTQSGNAVAYSPANVSFSSLASFFTSLFQGPPAVPRQKSGTAGPGGAVPTSATRAGRGAGTPAGKGAGQNPAFVPPKRTFTPGTSGAHGKAGAFDAKTSTLVGAKSSATVSYFQNADGSITRHIAQSPVNYQRSPGVWAPIDTTLTSDGNGRLTQKANSLGISFAGAGAAAPAAPAPTPSSVTPSAPAAPKAATPSPSPAPSPPASPAPAATPHKPATPATPAAPSGTTTPASYRQAAVPTTPSGELALVAISPTQSVGWSLGGASSVAPQVSGASATYPSILTGTALTETAGPTGVKESIVLSAAPTGNTWTFPLNVQGLTPELDSQGAVVFTDTQHKTVARIPLAFARDAKINPGSGDPATTWNVTYGLTQSGGVWSLTVTVDNNWLHDPARVYPVMIDPSLIVSIVNQTATTYTSSDGPGDYSSDTVIKSGECTAAACGSLQDAIGLIDFSAGSPTLDNTGYQATAASVTMFDTWTATPSAACNSWSTVNVAPVTRTWSVTGSKTYPGPSLGPVAGSAAPATPNACTNTSANPNVGDWVTIPINTTLVNNWSQGLQTDYGLAVYGATGSLTWRKFASDMDPNHTPYLGVTYTDQAPQVNAQFPANGYAAPTLTPELLAVASRPSGSTTSGALQYDFSVYNSAGVNVADSGVINAGDWTVPAGKLAWNQTYYWTVQSSDGSTSSPQPAFHSLTTVVPQPAITSSLSQNANGHGYDPASGNYTTAVTDAKVATVGPSLDVTRDYNSRDPRDGTAFGSSWSSVFDAHATEVRDAGGNLTSVTVTYPDGSEVGFGRNANGSFTPPSGRFATLSSVTGGYALIDKNNTTFTFTHSLGSGGYGITSVKDAANRAVTFTWSSGDITTMTSGVSGRALHLTWVNPSGSSASHISTVTTDQVSDSDPSSTISWQYSYSGDRLTKVCPPTSSTACTSYGYTTGSAHSSGAVDAGARSLWPLNESSGTVAHSAVLANEGADNGTYTNAVLGGVGPFEGGTSKAAQFNGNGYVTLPSSLADAESFESLSLWFQTSGANSVLFSSSADPITAGTTTNSYNPVLYIGSDGKLVGEFWQGSATTALKSTSALNNGNWHHVVLSAAGSTQTLYVDNTAVGTLTGAISLVGQPNNYIGAGYLGNSWPDESNNGVSHGTAAYFSGQIADVGLFNRPLSPSDVTALYNAGQRPASLLSTVTRPSGKTYASVGYDTDTSRVTAMTDENGGSWSMPAPTASGSSQVYRSAVLGSSPSGYWRLDDGAGSTDAYDVVNYGDGAYNNVTLDTQGPFEDNSAATFDGSSSVLTLPSTDQISTGPNTVELWFKTAPGLTNGGVLFGEQQCALGDESSGCGGWDPALYVGTDGKLHGEFWINNINAGQTSAALVNDGNWHHAVLSATTTSQTLYLDGRAVGTTSGTLSATGLGHIYVGAGEAGGAWPFAPTNSLGYFKGSIGEVSFYRSAISPDNVAAHYAAYKSGVSAYSPTVTAQLTDPGGHTLTHRYDPLNGNREISSTDGTGATTLYGYDAYGFPSTVTDPNGNVKLTGHDVRGNIVSESTCQNQAANNCSTAYFTYYPDDTTPAPTPNPKNDLLLTARAPGSSSATDNTYLSTYAYDGFGDRTSETTPPVPGYPSGRATTWTFADGTSTYPSDDAGNTPPALMMTMTTPGGAVTHYTYDTNGDLSTTTTPGDVQTARDYDNVGRVIDQELTWDSHPANVTTTYGYDKLGEVTSEVSPQITNRVTGAIHQASTTTSYDADGAVLSQSVADTSGGDASRTRSFTYDAHDQVASSTDGDGKTTTYGYDGYGHRTSQTDPLGNQTKQTYDANGNELATTLVGYTGSPSGSQSASDLVTASRSYDPAGRLASVTDAMGFVTSYTYTDNNMLATQTRSSTVPGNSGSYVQQSNTYNPAGFLTQQVTRNGALTTNYAVDAVGRVTSTQVDPLGADRVTTQTYNADDQVTNTTVADGTSTVANVDDSYDTPGNLTSRTVHTGSGTRVTGWTYDERGLPTSMTDAASKTTNYSYDDAGQLTVTTGPSVTSTVYSTVIGSATSVSARPVTSDGYDTFGEKAEQQDPNGNIVTTSYDADGQRSGQTLPNYTAPGTSTPITAQTSYQYDGDGQLTTLTDPLGKVTSYGYDQLGGKTTTTAPDTGVTTIGYDPNGEKLSVTDPVGAASSATYDYLGHQLTSTVVDRYPSQQVLTTTNTYDPAGNLATTTTPTNVATSYGYNKLGEQTSSTDAASNTTSYTRDAAGRTVKTLNPDGTSSTVSYNQAGDKTGTADFNSGGAQLRSTATGYDPLGRPTSLTDARGTTTTRVYDATGTLSGETQPTSGSSSVTVSYGHDLAGDQTTFTNGFGNTTYTTYNTWGMAEATVLPATTVYSGAANSTTTNSYDADARLVTQVQPGGVTVNSSYDAVGDLTGQTGSGASAATAARTFGYDLDGRMTSAATAAAGTSGSIGYQQATSETFSYNDRGGVLSASGSAGASSFGYAADGQMSSRVDSSGTSTYGYDTAGRLSTLADAASGVSSTYSYNAMSQVSSIHYGTSGGNTRSYGYDSLHRLTSDTLKTSASATVASISFGYNANNDVTSMTTTGVGSSGTTSNTYGYDLAGRLTSWNNGTSTATYGYDADGNLTNKNGVTYTYDDRDELTSDGANSYSYSANGNLTAQTPTTGPGVASASDAYGQQVTSGAESYALDALGRLVTATNTTIAMPTGSAGPAVTTLTYSGTGDQVASDGSASYSRDPSGQITGVNAGASGRSVAMNDQHDDLVGLFGSTSGTLTGSVAFDPWGSPAAVAGATMPQVGYQGAWTDPVAKRVDMAARWYNPATSDFQNRDTVATSPVDDPAAGANPYAYVNDDPMTGTDPTGHCWPSWACNAVKTVASAVVNGGKAIVSGAVTVAKAVVRAPSTVVSLVKDGYQVAKQVSTKVIQKVTSYAKQKAAPALRAVKTALHKGAGLAKAALHGLGTAAKATNRFLTSANNAFLDFQKGALEAVLHGAEGLGGVAAQEVQGHDVILGALGNHLKDTWNQFTGDELKGNMGAAWLDLINGVVPIKDLGGHLAAGIKDIGRGDFQGLGREWVTGGLDALAIVGLAAGGAGALEGIGDDVAAESVGIGSRATRGAADGLPSEQPPAARLACAVPHSFTGETPVLLAGGGSKPISQVRVGDLVANATPGGGLEAHRVENVIVTTTDHDMVRLSVRSVTDRQPPSAKSGGSAAGLRQRVAALTLAVAGLLGGVPATAAAAAATVSVGAEQALTTTPHHEFYDASTNTWTQAADLKEGDLLQTPTGYAAVESTHTYQANTTTYDLTITGLHTYYVQAGTTPVLVHNASCGEGSAAAAKEDWPVISGIVRDAASSKGNFGLGSASDAQAQRAGEAWVGAGWRWSSDGKAMVSEDGLRMFRPPTYKPNMGRYQANFEHKVPDQITSRPIGNGHLDITDLIP